MTGQQNFPDEPPSEWLKQQWKEAERAHDWQDSAAHSHMDQLEAFALQGIRTLALTAAGGIAAVLGFYSANYDRLASDASSLRAFNGTLAVLFTAMLFTLLVTLCGYFSQVFFAAVVYSRKRNYSPPYVEDSAKTPRLMLYGNINRVLAIVFAIAAALCLGVAGMSFMSLVR